MAAGGDDELAQAIALSLQDSEALTDGPHQKRRRSDESETEQAGHVPASTPEEQLERARVSAQAADTADRELVLAAPGETRRVRLAACTRGHRQMSALTVEHGSSLSLISKATTLLNLEFNDTDPEADWAKWEALGATVYFFAVPDQSNPAGAPACVLRTVLDGDFSADSGASLASTSGAAARTCSRRVIVDYLMTSAAARGRGYAGRLLECVRQLAHRSAANLLVLAIEESCPFWMTHGFVLDDGPINKRINCFPDTHLLKLPTNRPDEFPVSYESEAESEEEDEEEGEDEESDEDGDDQLQRALLASMAPAASPAAGSSTAAAGPNHAALADRAGCSAPIDLTEEGLTAHRGEDKEIEKAVSTAASAAAVGANQTARAAGAACSTPIDLTEESLTAQGEAKEGPEEEGNDDEAELQLAIALSLSCGTGGGHSSSGL